MPRLLIRTALTCAAVLGLTGCSGGSAIDLLHDEQTDRDVLTIRTDLDGIDLASTRFLAERDGVEYFVATPTDGAVTEAGEGACLLVEEGIGVGLECAPLERGLAGATIRDSRLTAMLLPDQVDRNALVDEGFELLHPNLAVRPAEAG